MKGGDRQRAREAERMVAKVRVVWLLVKGSAPHRQWVPSVKSGSVRLKTVEPSLCDRIVWGWGP